MTQFRCLHKGRISSDIDIGTLLSWVAKKICMKLFCFQLYNPTAATIYNIYIVIKHYALHKFQIFHKKSRFLERTRKVIIKGVI